MLGGGSALLPVWHRFERKFRRHLRKYVQELSGDAYFISLSDGVPTSIGFVDLIFCRLHVTQPDFLVLAKRFREGRIAA